MSHNNFEEGIPLGKHTDYQFDYDASLLFPIARQLGRDSLNISAQALPFAGADRWTAFELSWLNAKGVPQVAIAEFNFSCESKNIIESKSFKLYLNSFNQTKLLDATELQTILQTDLSRVCEGEVEAKLFSVDDYQIMEPDDFICIDDVDVVCSVYEPDVNLLNVDSVDIDKQRQKIKTHLLRSLCPVTGQPDWATLYIDYQGPVIEHSSLLAYIVSFRNHQGFHEQCVEQIFTDILHYCQASELSVYARYMRRGGLDINPIRFTSGYEQEAMALINARTARQ